MNYRKLIRSKTPRTIDMALKWCQVKEDWIEHTYKNFVKIRGTNDEKYDASIKICKGDFVDSICWDNLTWEEEKKWKRVTDWVNWFTKTYIPISEMYKQNVRYGYTPDLIRTKIKHAYFILLPEKTQNRLVEFLIKYIIEDATN